MPQDDNAQSTRDTKERPESSPARRGPSRGRVKINTNVRGPKLDKTIRSFPAWPSKKKEAEQDD